MERRTDDRLGSYSLGPKIGRGAMGVVHSATSLFVPDPVAIKILREDLSGDDETVARFLREKRIFSAVDHPNVVKVHDLVVEGDRLGLVMELIEGGDLKALIASQKLRLTEVIDLVRQIAAGLAHIHSVGVVHRDLKPANVLVSNLDGKRTAKISDFGVSRLIDDAEAHASAAAGTPLYMAPEAIKAQAAGSSADIYALGAMLFEMLLGKPPFFGGGKMAVVVAHSRYPAPQLGGLPPELGDLVGEMLSKNPSARPTAIEVANRLNVLAPLIDDEMIPSASTPITADAVRKPVSSAIPAGQESIFQTDRSVPVTPESETLFEVAQDSADSLWDTRAKTLPIRQTVSAPAAEPAVRRQQMLVAAAALVMLAGLVAWIARGPSDLVVAEGRPGDDSSSPQSVIADRSTATDPGGPTVLPAPAGPDNASDSTARFSTATPTTGLSGPSSSIPTSMPTSIPEQSSGSESTTSTTGRSTTLPPTTSPSSANPTTTSPTITIPTTVWTVSIVTAPRVVTTTIPAPQTVLLTSTTARQTTVRQTTSSSTTSSTTSVVSTTSTTRPPTTTTHPPTMATTPTTQPTTTAATTPPTSAVAAAQQVAIVSGPRIVSVGPTSAVFTYTTNDVCGTGSFVYRKQSTGEVVGRWIGDDGCFGPVHEGRTAWPGITLEPGTTYIVSITLDGKPSNGVLPSGTGRTTSSIVITTPV